MRITRGRAAECRGQSDVVASMLLVAIIIGAISAAYLWGLPLFTKSGDVTRLRYIQDSFDRIGSEILGIAIEGGQRKIELRIEEGRLKLERDETGEYVLSYIASTPVSFFPPQGVAINDWTMPYQQRSQELNFSTVYNSDTRWTNDTVDGTAYSLYVHNSSLVYDCMYKVPKGESPSGDCLSPGASVSPNFRIDYIDPDGTFGTLVDGMTTAIGLIGQDKPGVVIGQAEKVGNRFSTTITLKMRKIFDPTKNELVQVEISPAKGGSVTATGTFSLTFKNAGERVEIIDERLHRIVTVEMEVS